MQDFIEVEGARAHNLKNINIDIPRDQLVVITGLSGSGKSSLAFDTIYAEGQRRYLETFSAYARSFIGGMERPDVDRISGLSPVISIEQKTVNKNPRSTVGTITEVYDFLRLLFARGSNAYSRVTGERMVKYNEEQLVELVLEKYKGEKITVLSPVVKGRKGHYRELFEQIQKQGYVRARIDGEIEELKKGMRVDRYKIHDIEVVIDRLEVDEKHQKRIKESIKTALNMGKGTCIVQDLKTGKDQYLSRSFICPTSGISYDEPAPNMFSFNSPYGACPSCNGLGLVSEVDLQKIVPDPTKSIKKGGIAPLAEVKSARILQVIESILKQGDADLNTPIEDIEESLFNTLLYGAEDPVKVEVKNGPDYTYRFDGIISFIVQQAEESTSKSLKRWAGSFMNKVTCPSCNGSRLKQDALYFKIHDKNIADLAQMDILELHQWFGDVEQYLDDKQRLISKDVIKEIRARIGFLHDVGLDYLTLNRSSNSLSGGEAQRIRLATQIGSKLVGVLYILDEPSIGLHQRDNMRLIDSLKKLKDAGNSVLVVEHDKDMILEADYVIDVGPGAGVHGGEIVSASTPEDIKKSGSTTSQYLSGSKQIEIPAKRRKGNGNKLILHGASGHNLQNVKLTLPLGTFTCVTGVSGSGKSSLINGTLYPLLNQHLYKGVKRPLPYKKIEGLENIDKVIEIDQNPIGRTPRSNPATYTGVFSEIRNLFAITPEAKIRGYKPGRFSFNVAGGRCETCKGAGLRVIEMNFLPDVYVDCESCMGRRYNRETLEVKYKGKSISDVLNMTIDQAVEFFENIPVLKRKIGTLQEVGLGYLTLGQQSTTLSGGEAQRVKLATELSKKSTGKTLYILDEPSTGLHFEDIRILLEVLHKLVDEGNTVVVIEHNMDIIKVADHLIDLGPDGGKNGGQIMDQGTPEALIKRQKSITAHFLEKEICNPTFV